MSNDRQKQVKTPTEEDSREPKVPDEPTPDVGETRMEQIRELMSGSLVREFDSRLKQLNARVSDEIAALSDVFNRQVSELEARLSPQIERVQAQLRQESASRASALDDVDVRLHQALRVQRDDINRAIQRNEEDAAAAEARARAALAELERQVQASVSGLRQGLTDARTGLGNEKLARHDLADLLQEVALRLRDARDASRGN